MTRAEVEAMAANILNRPNDAQITSAVISLWFDVAHEDIQRGQQWVCQEATARADMPLYETGTQILDAPCDIKGTKMAFLYDPLKRQVIQFYAQTDINTLRFNRVSPDSSRIIDTLRKYGALDADYSYAIWGTKIELHPGPSPETDGMQFWLDYYRWLESPAALETTWFTRHAADYLAYRMLREAAPFIVNDTRLPLWLSQEQMALTRIQNADIALANSAPPYVRG